MTGTTPMHALSGILAVNDPGWWTRLWFGNESSTFAADVDAVFYYIFFVSAFFFVLLMGLLVYFGVKYRRRPGKPIEVSPSHNTALELTWSIIPTLLMVVMFVWGMVVFLDMRVAPSGSEEIYVTAKKWGWNFEYPNGATSIETLSDDPADYLAGEVATPVYAVPHNKPVKLIMTSTDVIHSFYIPAFRVKRDVLPNRYTTLWFETTGEPTHRFDPEIEKCVPVDNHVGELYTLLCTEYCGEKHSQMVARIAVLQSSGDPANPGDYEKWLRKQEDTSGIDYLELGRLLHTAKGCNACHSLDGSAGTGPSWTEAWASAPRPGWVNPDVDLYEGSPDAEKLAYLRESILNPQAYYVPGYEGKAMPSAQGMVTEREIRAIAIFMKSLNPATREAALEDEAREKAERDAAAAGGGAAEGG